MIRREFMYAAAMGAGTGLLLSSCTQTQVDDIQAKVVAVIQQVQAGVAKVCASAGKYVPTAETVASIILALLAASGKAAIAAATAPIIQAAIDEIASACSAPNTQLTARKTSVPVIFY